MNKILHKSLFACFSTFLYCILHKSQSLNENFLCGWVEKVYEISVGETRNSNGCLFDLLEKLSFQVNRPLRLHYLAVVEARIQAISEAFSSKPSIGEHALLSLSMRY